MWLLLIFLLAGSQVEGAGCAMPGLLAFKAKKIGDDVHLDWKMDEDYLTFDYIIERSLDSIDFSAISLVKAGSSMKGHNTYGFVDENVVVHDAEVLFYRLVQIGKKGSNQHSKVISVSQLENHGIIIDYFPNPKKEKVMNIAYMASGDGDLLMQIVNERGQSVFYDELKTGPGFRVVEVSVAKYPPGTYVIQLFDDRYAVSKEMEIE